MRKFIMTAAALFAMAGAAHAQGAASQNISLTANVGTACIVASPGATTQPITVNGGIVQTGAITISGGTVSCNQTANVSLRTLSGGLTNAGSANTPYTNKIHYTASAQLNAGGAGTVTTPTLNSSAGPNTTVTSAATVPAFGSGAVSITLNPQSASGTLIQGDYTDTLTVSVNPQ